jgi:hypothetical protein
LAAGSLTVNTITGGSNLYLLGGHTSYTLGSSFTTQYSYDLINWTPVRNSFFPSDGFDAGTMRIKYLNGAYYSLGSAASNGSNVNPILRSTDGIKFVAPTSAPTF